MFIASAASQPKAPLGAKYSSALNGAFERVPIKNRGNYKHRAPNGAESAHS
jgi:hypothetical protein